MEQLTPVVPQAHEGDASSSEAEGGKVMQSSKSGFSSSSSSNELEEPVEDEGGRLQESRGSKLRYAKSGFSSSSSSSSSEAEREHVNRGDLRPELQGGLPSFHVSAADSAAMAAQAVRRGSVSVANAKNKAGPSLRAFNDSKKKKGKSHGGAPSKRRNSCVVVNDAEGGAAEKIERQRRMSNLRMPEAPRQSASQVSGLPPAAEGAGDGDGQRQSRGSLQVSLPGEMPQEPAKVPPGDPLTLPASPSHAPSASPSQGPLTAVSVAMSRRPSVAPKISVTSESTQGAKTRWEYIKREAVPTCRQINKSKAFLLIMFVALLFALFFPDLWILVDRPTNVDLDVLLTLVFLMFVFEFVVQCIAGRNTYVGSFFFYMDILGGVSLLLDVNYIGIQALIQSMGDVGNQVVIARAARIAKLGARVGRFTKMVKMLRFLPGMGGEKAMGSAKVINSRLTHSLSTRVSCLIILLVLLIPMFSMWSFPQTDQSLMGWSSHLDQVSWGRPDVLARELAKFDDFYTNMNYFPYRVEVKDGVTLSNVTSNVLPWSSSRAAPSRSDGVQVQHSDFLSISYNFSGPNQMDSAMNLMLLLFVMVLMVSFSMVLQRTTSKMILHPVEKLLTQMKETADSIFESVPDLGGPGEEEQDSSDDENNEDGWKDANFKEEIHLLDKVVQKVTDLQKKEDKADSSAQQWVGARTGDDNEKKKNRVAGSLLPTGQQPGEQDREADTMTMVTAQYQLLDAAGLSVEALNTWNLSPLEHDPIMNRAQAAFIVGPANHGIRCEDYVQAFVEEVEKGYSRSNPYHNWFHAVDVAHATWRLANLCNVVEYLAFHETFAVLVASLGHSLGHPGVNARFLIETKHQLAMTYNDRSPLQNMSAAKLFEIMKKPGCGIFKVLSRSQYHTARKVTIDAILATDSALHFQNVKKVQMLYEMNSEVLDHCSEAFRESLEEDEEPSFPIPEVAEVFKEESTKQTLMKLLVHVAETSNPTKPFRICEIWVQKAMEENFLQGDEERLLGLPVQNLCDREKANLAYGQIGFIEYLVAPFLVTVTKVLPPAEPMLTQMMLNVKSWRDKWEASSQPSDEQRLAMRQRLADLYRLFRETRTSETRPGKP